MENKNMAAKMRYGDVYRVAQKK